MFRQTGPYHTSIGGRIFGILATIVLIVMAMGAAAVAVDALDGSATFHLRRGGRWSLSGWRAVLYGITSAGFGVGFLLLATGCVMGAIAPQRCGRVIWRLFSVAKILFVVTGVVALFALFSRLF
jgi:hypothetical protein